MLTWWSFVVVLLGFTLSISAASRVTTEAGHEEIVKQAVYDVQHAIQRGSDEVSTDETSTHLVIQETNVTAGLSEFLSELQQRTTCDAHAGCATSSGGRYRTPQTCARHGGARGCVWLSGSNCCGRVDSETMEHRDSHSCAACTRETLGDGDGDGIPDCMESPGCMFYGLPLFSWGARAGIRDIFVEVDWMASPPGDEGVTPRKEALQKVEQAFAAASAVEVAVHFDTGQMGGGNEVPYMRTLCPGGADQFATIEAIRAQHQELVRRTIFYYMLFGSTINPSGGDGASGGSRIRGTLVYVTLGGWQLTSNSKAHEHLLINTQASTLMHELGHALGLRHGGNDNTLNKPNYLSTMNYLYMHSGLPQIGRAWEGDRWYLDNAECHRHLCPANDCTWEQLNANLHAGPYSADFQIGYSHGFANEIDEGAVAEAHGLGQHSSDSAVDFDCDGQISPIPRRMIVHECIDDRLSRLDPTKPDFSGACQGKSGTKTRATVLHDHDDWGNLFLFFGAAYNPAFLALEPRSYLGQLQHFAMASGIVF